MKKRIVCLIVIMSFLIAGCSLVTEEINETKVKEAKYGQALKELTEDNSTTDPGLDKRYDYLQNQIKKIQEGKEELKMATFTRVKIEVDYLKMSNYSSSKISLLETNFMKTFAEAEKKAAEAEDYGGYSLSDRYYTLNKTIGTFSSGEEELKVLDFLKIENSLKKLEKDGYPVPNKINGLRNILYQAVIMELESAIVDYEVPEIEEEVIEEEEEEEEPTKEVIEEDKKEVGEIVPYVEPEVEEPTGPRTYLVELVNGGFGVSTLEIKTGDTVKWRNARSGQYKIALIIGNRECREVKSKLFRAGESYNATFTEPMTCWISDGIFTTQAMNVVVS
jgi:hypothetical protein